MNLSIRWLNDYVDTKGIGNHDFAESVTMSGSKVEGYSVEGENISGVIVGKILNIEKHPNADSLVICTVDVGEETLTIATGAKNLKIGDIVPVAKSGAFVAGGKQILSAPMRGVVSEGMLCSLSELGLTLHDFPYAVENGIFVLQEDCKLGEDIHEALGFNDTMFEFEITSNRPDCLSVTGLAREIAATYGKELKIPTPKIKNEIGNINDILKVEVQNKELCKRYVARAITDVKVEPSPRWLRERLRAMGVRPINNIVDITNFVMLEYGQPMHAFDVKTVAGGKIIARNAFEGEKIVTLDGVERTLSADMLVIADETAPSAIAGVMGSGRSGIREDTVTVIFESANFKGSNVRITAQKLGMRTEASGRFEKGLDTEICPMAADRACELVELLSAGKVMGGVIDVNNSQYAPKRIELQPQWINKFLGIFVPTDKMHEILKKLEFQIDGDYVIPPSFRGDIEHKADVAEEIARYYGYNKIPSTSIKGTVYGKVTRRQHLESLAVNTMLAQGLNEICTYTFFAPKAYDKIRLPEDSPLRNSVKILNPLGEDTSVMRTTPLPSMLAALATNYFDRNADSAFFEIAKEFIPKASVDELPFENTSLMLGMYGDKWDYYRLKGVVEAFLKAFGIDDYDVEPCKENPTFHPGRTAEIIIGDKVLAILGEVHPLVMANYEMDVRAYAAKIDFDACCALAKAGEKTYKPLPKFPVSTRDLALVCDDEMPVLRLEKAIKAAAGDILESIELFDCYRGAQIPSGKKSLAFALILRSDDHTLNEEELSAAMQKVYDAALKLGCKLRD